MNSNYFSRNWEDKSHVTDVAAIVPIGRTGVRNPQLLSTSRIRAIFHVFVYGFIFKGFNPFGQIKPHSDPFLYSNAPTSNFLKPRENIKEFHIGSFKACVDRSVRGLRISWWTDLSFFHNEWFWPIAIEWGGR